MDNVFLALGSNIGERETYLRQAVCLLHEHAAVTVERLSSIYETAPVGHVDQASFLNQVIEVKTTLTPVQFLQVTQMIENDLGRKRIVRFGPRTIDLDILLFGDENIEEEQLQIPHPRMWERLFVIAPLAELAPDIYSKVHGQTVRMLCDAYSWGQEGIKLWRAASLEAYMCLEK